VERRSAQSSAVVNFSFGEQRADLASPFFTDAYAEAVSLFYRHLTVAYVG